MHVFQQYMEKKNIYIYIYDYMYMYICNYAGFHSTDVHNYTELVYIHLPLHLLPLCRLVGKFMIVIPVATVCVLIGSFQRILYH